VSYSQRSLPEQRAPALLCAMSAQPSAPEEWDGLAGKAVESALHGDHWTRERCHLGTLVPCSALRCHTWHQPHMPCATLIVTWLV